MSELSKQALKVENNQSFPNNNAGLITPSALRTFNEDMIDSTVNQATYTTDSASFDSRINSITGSTGPLPSGVVSGSSQVILQQTTGNLSGSRIDGLVLSSSYALNSDKLDGKDSLQFATTGSNTFNGTQIIDSGNPANNAIFATQGDVVLLTGDVNVITGTGSFQHLIGSGLDYPKVDGQADMFMETDGNGNLIFDWVKTLHQNIHNATTSSIVRGTPLYISGSTGDNANVYFADASNTNRRPATLIAYDATLAPGATGTGIISGEIQGVDTTLYPEGTIVYLGVGGGWSATRPTGSANLVQALGVITRQANNGRGIVFNQIGNNLPNIQEGYAWVGDSTGVPVAISTGSWGGGGTPIDTGSFATTGSNTFVGTQTLSGATSNLILTSSGGEIKITQLPDFVTTFEGGYMEGVTSIYPKSSVFIISGSDYWEQSDDIRTVLGINGSSQDLRIGYGTTFGSSNYTHRFTSSSMETRGDVTINASGTGPNQLFIQRSASGAQQYLRLGPTDNEANFSFIVTGSDQNPGQQVWGINVQGGTWQNGFDAPTGFSNFASFASGITVRFGSGQPNSRMGVNHISESVEIYTGLSSNGTYIVSSSVDERILEVNPTTATVKVSNTISSQIFLNPQVLTGTQSVPSGFNGMITGPVSNAGTIVIEPGSTLVII